MPIIQAEHLFAYDSLTDGSSLCIFDCHIISRHCTQTLKEISAQFRKQLHHAFSDAVIECGGAFYCMLEQALEAILEDGFERGVWDQRT